MPMNADLADQIEPVFIRHPKVADEHFGIRHFERLDGFGGARRRCDDRPRFLEHFDKKPAGIGFIVHHEYAQSVEPDERQSRRGG